MCGSTSWRRPGGHATPPQYLKLPVIANLTGGSTRKVSLLEEMSMDFDDAPVAALLGVVRNGRLVPKMWHDPITENPALGSTEVWELYNATADATRSTSTRCSSRSWTGRRCAPTARARSCSPSRRSARQGGGNRGRPGSRTR
jgi:hypothetical protein